MHRRLSIEGLFVSAMLCAAPATATWKSGNPTVEAAAKDARIAAVLAAVNEIDQAAVADDHAAFAGLLADDLAVNNPQNAVSVRGATAQRSASGRISYSRYDRVIDYAGLREGMVILMGEEIVTPKNADGVVPERETHRRFTDVWKPVDRAWKLTIRQATIIERP